MDDNSRLDINQLNINTEVPPVAGQQRPAAGKEEKDCGCISLQDVSFEMAKALQDIKRW